MAEADLPHLTSRQFLRAPLASSGAADTAYYDRRDCERIEFSLRSRVSNRSARIHQSKVMEYVSVLALARENAGDHNNQLTFNGFLPPRAMAV